MPLMKSYIAWSVTRAACAQLATERPASSRACFILRRDAGFFLPTNLEFSSNMIKDDIRIFGFVNRFCRKSLTF